MSATWKPIPGYKGYSASRKGLIRNEETGHETKGGVSGSYRRVSVYPTGAKEPVLAYTHELVCLAFHGKGKKGEVVLHKDNDKLNCESDNLCWGTQSDNIQDAYDDGLIKKCSTESELRLPKSLRA